MCRMWRIWADGRMAAFPRRRQSGVRLSVQCCHVLPLPLVRGMGPRPVVETCHARISRPVELRLEIKCLVYAARCCGRVGHRLQHATDGCVDLRRQFDRRIVSRFR